MLTTLGGIVFYVLVDPIKHVWVPKCPFRLLTGWNCPVCGVQRALYALLHGHFHEAWAYNYFLIVCLPYVLALAVAEMLKGFEYDGRFVHTVFNPIVAKIYLILFFVWWIVRNVLGM